MPASASAEEFESLKWIIQFLSEGNRAFTLSEVQNLADDSSGSTLSELLEGDHELIRLSSTEEEAQFIGRSTLTRWLAYVNLRFSRIEVAQLSGQDWGRMLKAISLDCSHNSSQSSILEFELASSLVYGSKIGCRVVFPLAAVLSDCPNHHPTVNEIQLIFNSNAKSATKGMCVEEAVNEFLDAHWEERTIEIVKRREGLIGEPRQTLAELGRESGLSRERVRQFESRFWKSIDSKTKNQKNKLKTVRKRIKQLFRIFLEDFLAEDCSMVWKPSERGFSHRMFLAKCLGITTYSSKDLGVVVVGPAAKTLDILQNKSFQSALAVDSENIFGYFDSLALTQDIVSEQGHGLTDRDVVAIAESVADWRFNRLTKVQRVYLALHQLGRPAHYSEITDTYNTIFPDNISSKRNIHAILCRHELGIVWVGKRGTFALSEWGYSRPEKSLRDTVTEFVSAKYRKTGRPVPISDIHEKLQVFRGPINHNSLVFATEVNEKLRYVVGDAFVPSELLSAEYSKEYPHPRVQVAENRPEIMTDLLSVSSLAGFEFSGKQRKDLLRFGRRISILELKDLIERGQGSPELAKKFNSKSKILQADRSISRFQSISSSWVKGNRRDSRATWILTPKSVPIDISQRKLLEIIEEPFTTLTNGIPLSSIDSIQELYYSIEAQKDNRGQDLKPVDNEEALEYKLSEIRSILKEADWRQHFEDLDIWLPFLSLELIRRLKTMKSKTYGVLRRALIRTNRQTGLSDEVMPWTREFPTEIASLPLHWLYQFDPNASFLRILTTLSSVHCTNVGHLVAFHPVAWRTVRCFERKFWTRFAIKLDTILE